MSMSVEQMLEAYDQLKSCIDKVVNAIYIPAEDYTFTIEGGMITVNYTDYVLGDHYREYKEFPAQYLKMTEEEIEEAWDKYQAVKYQQECLANLKATILQLKRDIEYDMNRIGPNSPSLFKQILEHQIAIARLNLAEKEAELEKITNESGN